MTFWPQTPLLPEEEEVPKGANLHTAQRSHMLRINVYTRKWSGRGRGKKLGVEKEANSFRNDARLLSV